MLRQAPHKITQRQDDVILTGLQEQEDATYRRILCRQRASMRQPTQVTDGDEVAGVPDGGAALSRASGCDVTLGLASGRWSGMSATARAAWIRLDE